MRYELEFSEPALVDLARLKRDEPQSFRKAQKLLAELIEHPMTGTGKPELLTGELSGRWSRRISRKHRLVYSIEETKVVVYVLSAYGHYSDK